MSTVPIQTTLHVVGHAFLSVLATREDPAREALNTPLMRLLREEAEKIAPGAWDRAIEYAEESKLADPRALSEDVEEVFRKVIREVRR
jgi:hypothetical protein